MKEISQKTKILLLIIILVIILGAIIIVTKGFNFDMQYQESKKVELYIQKEFSVEDIKQITNEVFSNQEVIIQKVEIFEDMASIQTKEITEDQKEQLITKVNEKYGTGIKSEDTQTISLPHTKGRDIIRPYIMPLVIATVIILIYLVIPYRKIGIVKVLVQAILTIGLGQVLLFSIIAITGLPIGRYTTPLILVIYAISLLILVSSLEKQKSLEKKEEEK